MMGFKGCTQHHKPKGSSPMLSYLQYFQKKKKIHQQNVRMP